MSVPVIAMLDTRGGGDKTLLVYHLAWMLNDLGYPVLAADLDPQARLTAAFMEEDDLAPLWEGEGGAGSVWGALQPQLRGETEFVCPRVFTLADRLYVLPGDPLLAGLEESLGEAWLRCRERDERAVRAVASVHTALQRAAAATEASVVLVELATQLSALHRAALAAADFVLLCVAPNIYSFRSLECLGPRLRTWRSGWRERRERHEESVPGLPAGEMRPAGYIVPHSQVRLDRPAYSYPAWMARLPGGYARAVLDEPPAVESLGADPNCLAELRHFRSMLFLADEARKPVFHLLHADGALGSQQRAVQRTREEFKLLAERIADRTFSPPAHSEAAT